MPVEVRLAVAAGGAVGTLLRLAVNEAFPVTAFPLATLFVNLVGAYLLGRLAGSMPEASPRVRAFVGSGILGAFTTFAAVAVDVVALGHDPVLLVVYAMATLAGGISLARLGARQGAMAVLP